MKKVLHPISDLLWTAPELLRSFKPPINGTQKGDVYSYGIILSELAVNGEPYSMNQKPTESNSYHIDVQGSI